VTEPLHRKAERIMDNLERKYGPIAPPRGDYLPLSTQLKWEAKGLNEFELGRWVDMPVVFGDESQEATEELAWIYFLILAKQHYGLTMVEERALRILIADFLESIKVALYKWLVIHGQINDFETFRDVMYEASHIFEEEWAESIRNKERELYEIYGEEVYNLTDEEIMDKIIEEEWQQRRGSLAWLGPSAYTIREVIDAAKNLMNKIDVVLQTYKTYPLSDLIILLDAAVDFEHQNGKLLEDVYFYVDIVLAKKLAEMKFDEIYGVEHIKRRIRERTDQLERKTWVDILEELAMIYYVWDKGDIQGAHELALRWMNKYRQVLCQCPAGYPDVLNEMCNAPMDNPMIALDRFKWLIHESYAFAVCFVLKFPVHPEYRLPDEEINRIAQDVKMHGYIQTTPHIPWLPVVVDHTVFVVREIIDRLNHDPELALFVLGNIRKHRLDELL